MGSGSGFIDDCAERPMSLGKQAEVCRPNFKAKISEAKKRRKVFVTFNNALSDFLQSKISFAYIKTTELKSLYGYLHFQILSLDSEITSLIAEQEKFGQ